MVKKSEFEVENSTWGEPIIYVLIMTWNQSGELYGRIICVIAYLHLAKGISAPRMRHSSIGLFPLLFRISDRSTTPIRL
jgi:hypothetical protein